MTYTKRQCEAAANLYVRHLPEELEAAESEGVKQVLVALMLLGQEGKSQTQVAEVLSAAWYELECQGFLEPMEGDFFV